MSLIDKTFVFSVVLIMLLAVGYVQKVNAETEVCSRIGNATVCNSYD